MRIGVDLGGHKIEAAAIARDGVRGAAWLWPDPEAGQ